MKYIRTKDGIYKQEWYEINGDNYTYMLRDKKIPMFSKMDIIEESDTIEELCDEFVIITSTYDIYKELSIGLIQKHLERKYKIYGAIWTDKGLIYVAKMNDKGELELI